MRLGDLLDVLAPGERFDVIFWNSNFVCAPSDHVIGGDEHRAFCDPGYLAHDRFLTEALRYPASGGALLLGSSGQGNADALQAMLHKHGQATTTVSSTLDVGPNAHRYDLVGRLRIGWLLKELPYVYVAKHFKRDGGEHKQADFLAINAQGRIPVLELEELVIPQSLAILEYLK